MHRFIVLLLALTACGSTATSAPEPEPEAAPAPTLEPQARARVFFRSPADGARVKSPLKIEFGVEGMQVRPAGELAENTGHHHVIIGPAGIATGQVVPADEKHIHFGAGQTEAELALPPGDHKLTMQFADGNHTSYGEVMAATITVTVEE